MPLNRSRVVCIVRSQFFNTLAVTGAQGARVPSSGVGWARLGHPRAARAGHHIGRPPPVATLAVTVATITTITTLTTTATTVQTFTPENYDHPHHQHRQHHHATVVVTSFSATTNSPAIIANDTAAATYALPLLLPAISAPTPTPSPQTSRTPPTPVTAASGTLTVSDIGPGIPLVVEGCVLEHPRENFPRKYVSSLARASKCRKCQFCNLQ